MKRYLPLITLMVLSPLLVELVTTNIVVTRFFQPDTLFFLLVVGYGLPVVLIREVSVRYRFGFSGIFLLGIVYGFFNEALIAKTILLFDDLPIEAYNTYASYGGVSVAWTVFITVWHSFVSVVFPIMITHFLFPNDASRPWLPRWVSYSIGFALMAFAIFSFLHDGVRKAATSVQAGIVFTSMIVLTMSAFLFRRTVALMPIVQPVTIAPLLWGMTIFVSFFVVMSMLAQNGVALALYLLVFMAILVGYWALFRRKGWLSMPHILLFAIGFYIQQVILGIGTQLGVSPHETETVIMGMIVMIGLLWLGRRVLRRYTTE